MKKLLLGALLAALALMTWGFVFWATPLSGSTLQPSADDAALRAALSEVLPETGTYLLPGPTDDLEAYAANHEAGPLALIHFRAEGTPMMAPSLFLKGFLHMFATALLIGLLMRSVNLPTYRRRFAFAAFAGLAASFWINLSGPIWFYEPWAFNVFTFLYDVIAWVIAGSVLAKFVVPERQAAFA
ncbi:MAG: hypothetical protein RhofKO_00280 [Rhodothermales bacterium]